MMKPGKFFLIFWAFLGAQFLGAQAEISLSGRIVDDAHLLSPVQYSELEKYLADYESKTSNQIVVVTLKSLEGKNIEEYALELGRRWGIGTKEKNNGVLVLIALEERSVRIEVAYGLEDILTDAQAKIIIERNILPYFRRGEMGEGIIQGVHTIVATLGGEEQELRSSDEEQVSNWSFLLFIIAMIFILFIRSSSGRGPRPPRSGGIFGGGDGRSSSGGFSGGGGSFGGGGASGKW